MKRIIFCILFLCFSTIPVKSQDVQLIYDDFVEFLTIRYPSCFYTSNGELWFRTNCTEITTEDSLTFHGISGMNPEPLQYFTSLIYLDCSDNEIDFHGFIFPASLKYINGRNCCAFASSPQLILPPGLEYLNLSENENYIQGSAILAFPSSLKYIDISNCFFSSMPALPTSLDTLICYYQGIWGLTELPPLPNNLRYLDCSDNALDSLPALPASLKYLDCSNQGRRMNPAYYDRILASLPILPSSLEYLDCSYNKLLTLPDLPGSLTFLKCSWQRWFNYELDQNPVTDTFLKYPGIPCLPHLPSSLTTIFVGFNEISCLPNTGGLSSLPLPICSPINNPNHCFSMPVISGRIFYDVNSNGTKEPSENYRANVEAYTNSGLHAFTNDTGYFEVSGDTGLNIVNIIAPPFYSVVPPTGSYTFNSFDTIVSQLYALQPQVSADSVSVSLARTSPTRPGFLCSFRLEYENVGTTTVPANITVGYNPAHLSYQSAGMPGVTDNGSLLTIPAINLSPGGQGSINLYFNVLQSSTLGDTTYLHAHCTAGSSVMHDSVYAVITGSFDPNDKNATPKLTPQQVSAGTFINYLIRFQNTGNDTAINVVITDTLDAQLEHSSFQLISASHTAVVKREGRNLSFEFFNIMLPDSNVNEPQSHGFIRFRAKPLSTVTAGSIIPNLADIYFDYNSPVSTNSTSTTIQGSVIPLSLLSFDLMHDGSKNALLRWSTAGDINTRLFEIERSSNGISFEQSGTVTAAGQGDNTYFFKTALNSAITYFRLKIIDADNRYSYSAIKKLQMIKEGNIISVVTNPARYILTINCPQTSFIGSKALLVDHSGKKLMEFSIKGGLQHLDISGLSAGLYHLRTADGTKKVMVKR